MTDTINTTPRPVNDHGGILTGQILDSYEDFCDAPIGTVAVSTTGLLGLVPRT